MLHKKNMKISRAHVLTLSFISSFNRSVLNCSELLICIRVYDLAESKILPIGSHLLYALEILRAWYDHCWHGIRHGTKLLRLLFNASLSFESGFTTQVNTPCC